MPKFLRVNPGGKFSAKDVNAQAEYLEALINLKVTGGVFNIARGGASLNIPQSVYSLHKLVVLNADLDAPTDPLVAASTAEATVLKAAGPGLAPNLEETEETLLVVNRSENFSATQGDLLLVGRVDIRSGLEWHPIVSGSTSTGGGGGVWVMSIVEFVSGCACRVAWCLVLRTPCGDNRWLPGDLVPVFDDLECVLNDTEDRLVGVKVVVSRTEGDDYTASSLGAECAPEGYNASAAGSCHFTFIRRCCLDPL